MNLFADGHEVHSPATTSEQQQQQQQLTMLFAPDVRPSCSRRLGIIIHLVSERNYYFPGSPLIQIQMHSWMGTCFVEINIADVIVFFFFFLLFDPFVIPPLWQRLMKFAPSATEIYTYRKAHVWIKNMRPQLTCYCGRGQKMQ